MKNLYLIRHGRTEANEKRLYCGSTDLSLSENGAEELKALHYEDQIPKSCTFITSGMKRTEQTLEILFGNVSHRADPHFREIDFGVFEMKGYEELKNRVDYQAWISGDNEKNIPPEGESGEQMLKRVREGIKELQKLEGDIVLIAHGGVIAAMMSVLFPEEKKSRYEWQPKPGHGYVIQNEQYKELKTNENSI